MSQKSQADQHTLSEVAPVAEGGAARAFHSPLVMVTASNKVYVSDKTITTWEESSIPAPSAE
jgi:mevalonate pyrophosphate decarboxylase